VLLAPGWVRCERHVVPHNVAFVVAVGVVLEVLARIARTDGTGARLAHRDLQLAAAGRRSSTRNGLRPLGGCLAQRNVRGGHVNRGSWSRCSQGRRNRLQRRTVQEGYRHGRAPVPLGWVVRPMRLARGRAAAGVTKDWTFVAQRAAQLLGAASLTGVCDKTVSRLAIDRQTVWLALSEFKLSNIQSHLSLYGDSAPRKRAAHITCAAHGQQSADAASGTFPAVSTADVGRCRRLRGLAHMPRARHVGALARQRCAHEGAAGCAGSPAPGGVT
jgi:hypothetical protein